ncbi:L-glutamine synthetase [Raineyella antarctica]|uniref:L-glutamine synthetase n=1 Tax=Raineyella antarctica TaxID=1577474 RepID=A0A1G6HHR5_9ACTN|nr:glutamine synthetase family protein [Raineyella antarctica]SDB93734.1 L-glutamine synthetase [Raineyella antarctica]
MLTAERVDAQADVHAWSMDAARTDPTLSPLPEGDAVDRLEQQLRTDGVRWIIGTATNAAGLVLAKSIPAPRLTAFVRSGCGLSPAHNAYGVDGSVVDAASVPHVGDLRLRLDPSGVRMIGDGIAMGPTDTFFQDGTPDPACPRVVLAKAVRDLAEQGLHAMVGHEVEFVLVRPDGSLLDPGNWRPYGANALLGQEELVLDLLAGFERAGIGVEQVHAEYGEAQFEVSLGPDDPIRSADALITARVLIVRTARRHGLMASFSPLPEVGKVGNGAHQHLSLRRGNEPLFSGGDGPHGLTGEGAHAIAGLVRGLPQAQAVLAGSALSGARLQPGGWSGAYACWGRENREAAVRFVTDGMSNPHGANVEVKMIDASANPYLATASLLGLALDGIRRRLPLPAEVTTDPADLSDTDRVHAGVTRLASDQAAMVDALESSEEMRRILGDPVVTAVLAVRRHEQVLFAGMPPEGVAAALRLAWS